MSIVSRSTQQYSGFDPRSIPGCALWLDAADRNTMTFSSGNSVSAWRDKSGNNNHTTSQSGTITYSQQGRVLLSNSYFLGSFGSAITGSSLQCFAVASMNPSTTQYGRILSLGRPGVNDYDQPTTTFPFVRNDNSETLMIGRNSSYTTGVGIVYNKLFVVTSGHTGNGGEFISVNGNTDTTATTTTGNFNISSYGIGTNTNTGDLVGYWYGEICEVLVFNNALTTAQRQQIEGYLAWKWSLTTNAGLASPSTIPGLALWLDAADPNAIVFGTGSNITRLIDKSPLKLTLTNATSFTYDSVNKAYVGTLANGSLGSVTLALSQPVTIFAVAVHTSTSFGYICDGLTSTNRIALYNNGSYTPAMFAGTSIFGSSNLMNTNNVYSAVFNTANSELFRNGTSIASGNVGTGSVAGFSIATAWSSNAGWLGSINEILIFDTTLTTTQRQTIEGYLAWKWGLQRSLPTSHPYNSPFALPTSHPFRSTPVFTRPFQPSDVDGLALWLDAADSNSMFQNTTFTSPLTSLGQNVQGWSDKSGNGRNMTYTGSNPTFVQYNGRNAVSLNTSGFKQFSSVDLSAFTYFLVMAQPTGRYDTVLSATPVSNVYSYSSRDGFVLNVDGRAASRSIFLNYGIDANDNQVKAVSYTNIPPATADAIPPMILGMTMTSAGFGTSFINGVEGGVSASSNARTTTSRGIALGGYYLNSDNFGGSAVGYIYELLMYTGVLTTTQRQQIEGYLYAKWNIPVTRHPYYRIQSLPTTPLFTPASLSGLQLWLDAADTSTIGFSGSGSNVSQWNDKSGNGYNLAQTTLANQPTFSNQQILLNGSQWLRNTISTSFGDSGTLIVVANTTTNTGTGSPINITSVSKLQAGMYMGSQFTAYFYNSTNNHVANLGGTTTSPAIWVNTRNGSSNPQYTNNGGALTTYSGLDPTGYTFSGTMEVGSVNNGVNAKFTGSIYEILYYNTYLTTSQRQAVEGYLAWKWGLQTNLPLKFSRTIQSPLAISGCQLWLDAADSSGVTTDVSGNVSQWTDKSGNNRHITQTTGLNRPSYTIGSNIRFASGRFLQNSFSLALANVSVFVVMQYETASAQNSCLFNLIPSSGTDYESTNSLFISYQTTPLSELYYCGSGENYYNTPNNQTIYSVVASNGTYTGLGNGVSFAIKTATPGTSTGLLLNGRYLSGSRDSGFQGAGTISEIIIYNSALTTTQRQSVEAYLQNKWNVAVPVAHPYKAFRP